MADRLAGKVAIVTGAASVGPGVGIGKAVALLFAREGASVVLVNRSQAHAEGLKREIDAEGGRSLVYAADVTDAGQVERMMDQVVARYGRLDILHNTVGIGAPGTVVNVAEAIWDQAMTVNLKSAMWCSRFAIPRMIAGGGGSIINVSSLAAIQGFRRGERGFAAYAASKAGLIGLTLATAADHSTAGVRANCLMVGMVHTPRLEEAGEEARKKRHAAIPLGTEGTAWDVGWAAVFLASEESRWITGAVIPIDGGQSSIRDWPA
jgi:NAD(P)-dependent dehydrogenase (short-subunit alcohol dehydrogenase family)